MLTYRYKWDNLMKKLIIASLFLSATHMAYAASISEAKAKEIALKDAALAESSIRKYEIELDNDDGRMVYEIEFTHENKEYDYEIDANSGKIIKKKIEKD